MPEPLARVALALGVLALAAGCAKQPYAKQPCARPDLSGCVVDEVRFRGNAEIPSSDIKEKIATTETDRPFGGALEDIPILSAWDRLLLTYQRLDPYVLARDLSRIERFYRSRGYYEAHVEAARTWKDADGHAHVEVKVDEGLPVDVAAVDVKLEDGPGPTTTGARRDLADAVHDLKVGKPFDETVFDDAKKKIQRVYTDRGYAYATVEGHASVDLVKHEATLVYDVKLGPLCTFGPITLTDLGELPEGPIRARMDIKTGERYSAAKLEDAELDLARLGVFGAIDAKPALSPKDAIKKDTEVPVTIEAQQAQLRLITWGFGGEIGSHLEAHGIARWENKNLFGGLRYFSVDAKPGFVFYPTRIDTLFSQRPTNLLPELRVRASFKQPGFLEPRTDFVTNQQFAVYRPETPTNTLNAGGYIPVNFGTNNQNTYYTPAVDNIIGYDEYAGNVGLERYWFKNRIKSGIYYDVQLDRPFSYNQPGIPDGYKRVLILYPEALAIFDFRRDQAGKYGATAQVDPHGGVYTSIDTQLAFGGDVRDLRVRPEVRLYLPVTRKITLGFRAVAGLLFPFNYGDSLKRNAPACAENDAACVDAAARDQQLMQFRAFFSGGPNSNRGYPFNGVGPQSTVTFITPLANIGDVIATGGFTLWESSLELRVPFGGSLGGVLFVDASDVTSDVAYFRLTAPHLSTGVGLRYNTPVGPFRVDLGYRIPDLQVIGVKGDVPASEGTAGTILGLPITFNLAIGEAF